MISILIKEPYDFPVDVIERLNTVGKVYKSGDDYPRNAISVVFIRLAEFIGEEFYLAHPNLKYVVSPTTGLNHVDIEYFSSQGVEVLTLKGHTSFLENIHATAEHTIALTLSLLRKLPTAVRSVNAGEWNRYPFKGGEINNRNVYIVGYGRLGKKVAALFRAFGAHVSAYDIDQSKVDDELFKPLMEGLQEADIVSLHVNLDEQSKNFFNADLIKQIKVGAIFINTARGEIIDQKFLLNRLDSGALSGVALDVLRDEPEPLDKTIKKMLDKHPQRLLVTPHIGGFTKESLSTVERFIAGQLMDRLAGR